MSKLKIATVFSGIGAIEYALRRMNVDYEVLFACDNGEREIDYDATSELELIKNLNSVKEKREYVDDLYSTNTRRTNFVEKTYRANYQNELIDDNYFQDIRLLDGTDFKNKVDLFVGGSPCQSFSTVGFQGGLEDARGTLFYDYARLVKEIQPKVFIYENVRGMLNHDKGKTWEVIKNIFDGLGYNLSFEVLNARDFGIPQNRRRLFVVGTKKDSTFDISKIPQKELLFSSQDFLIEKNKFGEMKYDKDGQIVFGQNDGEIEEKYFLSPKLLAYVTKGGTKTFYQKPVTDNRVARTLLKSMGNRHRAGVDNYYTVDGKLRMLSEREALRLMGFCDEFIFPCSRCQGYKQAGNSIVVDVLMSILEGIFKSRLMED